MVGVGLFYRQGYFHQRLDSRRLAARVLDRRRLRAPAGRARHRPRRATADRRGRDARARRAHARSGASTSAACRSTCSTPIAQDNHPIDRWITARLYIGDRHTRLAQYARARHRRHARARARWAFDPALVHLNEGHAALSSFERLRELLRRRRRRSTRRWPRCGSETVFTTHTPVPAGNEGYTLGRGRAGARATSSTRSASRATTFYDLGRIVPGDEREPVSHHAAGAAHQPRRQRRVAAPRRGGARHVAAAVAGARRRATCRSATSPTACTPRPGWRSRCRRCSTAISAATGATDSAMRRCGKRIDRDSRRRALGGALRAARAAGRIRARAHRCAIGWRAARRPTTSRRRRASSIPTC